MKIKSTAVLAVFAIITVSASAAIAREIIDGKPAPKMKRVHKQEVAEEDNYVCHGHFDFPVAPKDQKRLESLVGWNYEPRPVGYYNNDSSRYVIKQKFLVSAYPKKGYVLNTNGQYVLER